MPDTNRQELIRKQTEIRRALLRNGYSPFPCEGKNGQIQGWPDVQATEELIDEWSEQLRWVSTAVHTGVRGLVGLDIDIDDPEVLEDFVDRIPDDLWARLKAAPVRRGGGVKEMWLVRLADGEEARRYKDSTGKWGDPNSGEDDSDHKIEVWAKERKLLALYGARTVEAREITSVYSWVDDVGPHCVPVEDLPQITNADIDTLLRCGVEAMQARGWERLDVSEPSEGAERLFDLTDDMKFQTRDHGEVDLAGLVELCGAVGDVRLYSWLPGKRRRADRCHAKLNDYDGLLQIHDYDTGVTHRMAEADGAYARKISDDVQDRVSRLRERLGRAGRPDGAGDSGGSSGSEGAVAGEDLFARLLARSDPEKRIFSESGVNEGGAGPSEEDVEAQREAIVRALLDRYGYWSDGRGYVVDVHGGIENAMTLGSFQTKMAPLSWKEKPAKGPTKEINPADLWKKHPDRVDVAGFKFLPDARERVVVRGEQVFINTWERPAWWDDERTREDGCGAIEAFQRFLGHLIPDEAERDWFVGWLAAKVQKPWLPNCGVIMVAERQGTGRGTLFDMLRGVFGPRHVNNVAAVQLIGGGSQAQYTDWMENALIVTCDEVLAGDDAGGAMAWKRREVYERLKALVDPRPRPMPIVRKGLPNTLTEVYASFLLATNNVNALPLSADDRRIAVVTNTGVPLAEVSEVMDALAPWRHETLGFSEAFSAALYTWLRGQEVSMDEVREAPKWMRGREEMLAANETDLDEVLENVLRRIEGDFVLGHHLRERLGRSIEANGLDGEIKGWWNKAQDILGRPNRLGWRRIPGRHKFAPAKDTTGTTVTSVFYRCEGAGVDAWVSASLAERAELWKGGDSSFRSTKESVAQRMKDSGLKPV